MIRGALDIHAKLQPRLRFFLGLVLANMLVLAVLRLAFLAAFWRTAPPAETSVVAKAFYIGLKFDLRLALILAFAAWVLGLMPGLSPVATARGRRLALAFQVLAGTFVLLAYIVDFAHYAWLGYRVNSTVTEHLFALDIALTAVWESYPVTLIVLGLGALVAAYAALMSRLALRHLAVEAKPSTRALRIAAFLATVLLGLGGAYGKWSWYPLRWSDAYFEPNPFVTALALNPILQVAETWNNRKIEYDLEAYKKAYPVVAKHLGVASPDLGSFRLDRQVAPRLARERPVNVVIVFMESFAAFKVGVIGNPLDGTPHFDELARNGLYFPNYFSATAPTARSIFSCITGVPDLNTTRSASRNPLVVDQRTVLNSFKGYDKIYMLGGSASWGNIRGVLTANVPDVRLIEEGMFPQARGDVWGISDLDLLREAHRVFNRQEGRPFIAFIQTAGNHRPWTIPEDHGDFENVQVDADKLLAAGFLEGLEAFNSLRFLDYSIGEFFRLARPEPWFEDTVFFLFGDHGLGAPGELPWSKVLLSGVHTPLVIYGPQLLGEPRTVETVASSLDVLPTAAGLAGLPYTNTTLGRDIFDGRPDDKHFAFVRLPPRVGLVGNEFFLSFEPDGSRRLYPYREKPLPEDLSARYPELTERMAALCTGMYESARYLLYNNHRGIKRP